MPKLCIIMNMKTFAFIKAHKITLGLIDEYLKIKASGIDSIILLDNKNEEYDVKDNCLQDINYYGVDVPCYFMNFEIYQKHKFPGYYDEKDGDNFNHFMWYNADYPIYLVANLFPDYDYYWQIEYDVYCNGKSYKTFFDEYENNKSDLLICRYGIASNQWWPTEKTDWVWSKDIRKCCCILPIMRLSRSAANYLYEKRLEHGEIYKKQMDSEDARWIFCEIFVATEITNSKLFKGAPILNQVITDRPIINLAETRLYLMPDNKLYHPVK